MWVEKPSSLKCYIDQKVASSNSAGSALKIMVGQWSMTAEISTLTVWKTLWLVTLTAEFICSLYSLKTCFSRLHVKSFEKSNNCFYLWHKSDIMLGVVSFVIFNDRLLTRLSCYFSISSKCSWCDFNTNMKEPVLWYCLFQPVSLYSSQYLLFITNHKT